MRRKISGWLMRGRCNMNSGTNHKNMEGNKSGELKLGGGAARDWYGEMEDATEIVGTRLVIA